MADKRIDVTLGIRADITQAKKHLKDLQTTLASITNERTDITMSSQIKEATAEATRLRAILATATTKDGHLDLSKFSQSLQQSGNNLQTLRTKLESLGPQGSKAFLQLTQSIQAAQIPTRKMNTMIASMWTSLKNAAKWQISSSVLHGLIGGLQQAMGYAKDLNKNLNDIRIVTNQSVESMEEFAKKANAAAKALSTTTNEYAKASLIYYQQGLGAKEIEERTQATIKMANVTGQAAQTVSDQMTAIWNNFDNGSKSLEYYADVVTALGAATASSSDEIAQGLEKFAAVAETVGLSYEYATAALATVTSETRQSADVVGTAFKTLFSRIQGLKLGETLDDGTTLNKYSEGLLAVGINIKDSKGQLKEMDVILNEMGEKWKKLNKDQQVALAQTVGGIRQYNQLISLMDNWDTFKVNLEVAEGSEGTLNEQQMIYEESWEASSKRVKASLEKLFNELIDDDFFIDFNNGIEDAIETVTKLVKSLGGVSGTLSAIGMLVTRVFSTQLANGINNLIGAGNFKSMAAQAQALKQEAIMQNSQISSSAADSRSVASQAQSFSLNAASEDIDLYYTKVKDLNEIDQANVRILMDRNAKIRESIELLGEEVDAARKVNEVSSKKLGGTKGLHYRDEATGISHDAVAEYKTNYLQSSRAQNLMVGLDSAFGEDGTADYVQLKEIITQVKNEAGQLGMTMEEAFGGDIAKAIDQIEKELDQAEQAAKDAKKTFEEYMSSTAKDPKAKGSQKKIGEATDNLRNGVQSKEKKAAEKRKILETEKAKQHGVTEIEAKKAVTGYTAGLDKQIAKEDQIIEKLRKHAEGQRQVNKTIDEGKGKIAGYDPGKAIAGIASTLMSVSTVVNSFNSIMKTLENPDLSPWEKFTSVLMSFSMIMTGVITLSKAWKDVQLKDSLTTAGNTVAKWLNVLATKAQAKAKRELAKITDLSTKKTNEETVADTVNSMGKKSKAKKTSKGTTGKIKGKKGKTKVPPTTGSGAAVPAATGGGTAATGAGATGAGAGGTTTAAAGLTGMAALGTLLAGIVVAGAIIYQGVKLWNKAADDAKDAAKAASSAIEAFNSTQQAYDEFKDTTSSYKEGVDGLKELTKGTVEYREAIIKANEDAMKLIESTEGLEYKINGEGLIEIDEESLKQAQEKKIQQLQNAQISKQIAQNVADQKQAEADRVKLQRDKIRTSGGVDTINAVASSTGSATALGAAIGTIILPGLGSAIGAGLGAVTGLIIGGVTAAVGGASTKKEDEAIDKLVNLYAKEGNAIFATDDSLEKALRDLGITDEKLISELVENRNAVYEQVKAEHQNTEATLALARQMIQQQYQKQLDVSGLSESGQAAAVADIDEKQKAKADELYEKKWKDKSDGKTDKEIQELYAKAMGYKSVKNKTGNKAEYEIAPGQFEVIADSVARNYLAMQEASRLVGKELTISIQELSKFENSVSQLVGEGGENSQAKDVFSSFYGGAGGSFDNLTKEELENFEKLSNEDKKTILSYWKNLEYESEKEFENSLIEASKEANEKWENIKKSMLPEVQAIYASTETALYKKMTTDQAQRYADLLDSIYLTQGEEAAKNFSKALEDMSNQDIGKFFALQDSIDWNTITVEELRQKLQESGIETRFTNEALMGMIQGLQESGTSIEKFKNQLKLLKELDDVEQGSNIEKDQYDNLPPQLQSYFTLMIDGTYKLTESALQFKNAVKDTTNNIYSGLEKEYFNNLSSIQNATANIDDLFSYRKETFYIGGDVGNKETKVSSKTMKASDMTYEAFKGQIDSTIQGITPQGEIIFPYLDGYDTLKQVYNAQQTMINSLATPILLKTQSGTAIEYGDIFYQQNRDQVNYKVNQVDSTLKAFEAYMNQEANKTEEDIANLELAKKYQDLDVSDNDWKNSEIVPLLEKITQGSYKQGFSDFLNTNWAEKVFQVDLSQALNQNSIEDLKALEESGDINSIVANQAYETVKSKEIALDPKEVEDYTKYIMEIAESSDKLDDTLANNSKAAESVARNTLQTNRGIETLSSNFKTWEKILKEGNKETEDYADALVQTRKAVADLINVSEDSIGIDFFEKTENLELIKKASEGSEEALSKLRSEAAKAIVVKVLLENKIEEGSKEYKEAMTAWEDFSSKFKNLSVGVELEPIKLDEALKAYNKLIQVSGMTTTECNEALAGIGVEPVYRTVKIKKEDSVPQYETVTETHREYPNPENPNHWIDTTTSTVKEIAPKVLESEQQVGAITSDGSTPDVDVGSQTVSTGGSSASTSSGGGTTTTTTTHGGGEKIDIGNGQTITTVGEDYDGETVDLQLTGEGPIGFRTVGSTFKNPIFNDPSVNDGGKDNTPEDYTDQKKDLDDIVERYEYIENILQDIEKDVDRLNKDADRLWGANRIKALTEVNKKLEEQKKSLLTKQDEIKANLAIDQQAASAAGFTFDKEGRINNKDAVLAAATGEWNSVIDKLNSYSTKEEQDKYKESEEYKQAEKNIEELQKVATQYEETRDLYIDNQDAVKDLTYAIQDNNQLIINHEYDVGKTLTDVAGQIADTIAIELEGSLDIISAKMKTYYDQIKTTTTNAIKLSNYTDTFFNKTMDADISAADKVENIQTIISDYISTYQTLNEVLDEVFQAYNVALETGSDKINQTLEEFDIIINKIDHYRNLLGLMGKENDIALNKQLNKSTIEAEKANVLSRFKYMENLKVERDEIIKQQDDILANAVAGLTEEAKIEEAINNAKSGKLYAALEENKSTIDSYLREEEDAIMSSTENIFTLLQEQLELNLEEAKKKFSKALAGMEREGENKQFFGSLEQMTNQFDRQTQIQEMFLTKTNKVYETSKLIRQAQLAMDKTDNELSKKKYQGYIKLVENLQGQTEISQEELDIAQARYEVLQAQIALEEAQHAKSVVRLTRNAEGNWGYMYTADEDKIAEAEQNLEDAENKLYNTGLDAAKSYAEQRVEILKSMYDELTEVQEKAAKGEYTDEEAKAEIARIRGFYERRYAVAEEQYGNGMNVLGEFDATMELTYGDDLITSDEFGKIISDYINNSNEAIEEWKTEIKNYSEDLYIPLDQLNTTLDNLSQSVKDTSVQISKDIGRLTTLIDEVYKMWNEPDKDNPFKIKGKEVGIVEFIAQALKSVAENLNIGYDNLINESQKIDFTPSKVETGVDDTEKEPAETPEAPKEPEAPKNPVVPDSGLGGGKAITNIKPSINWYPFENHGLKSWNEEQMLEKAGVSKWSDILGTNKKPENGEIVHFKDFANVSAYTSTFEEFTIGTNGGCYGAIAGKPISRTLTETQADGTSIETTKQYYPIISFNPVILFDGGKGLVTDEGSNLMAYISEDDLPNLLSSYDTGGYTGQWGPEGKLATLHEKEIVLNKYDTENFLQAIEMVRSIADFIEQNASTSALGLLGYGNLNIPYSKSDEILQQEITIHADFPNVQNRTEIEEAFNNLLNTASQYANRKK